MLRNDHKFITTWPASSTLTPRLDPTPTLVNSDSRPAKQPAMPNVIDQDLLKFEETYAKEIIRHGVADFYIRDGATLAIIVGQRIANGEFALKEVVLQSCFSSQWVANWTKFKII